MSTAFPRGAMTAADIARQLAERIEQLAPDLLPNGHREGNEWRVGSIRGEPGNSLAVHLTGSKAGIWCDFANVGIGGDTLALVTAVLGLSVTEAMDWACRWLGIVAGDVTLPKRAPIAPKPPASSSPDPDRWRHSWTAAKPIHGTLAETYLKARRLEFDDAEGRVLRFAARRARQPPGAIDDQLEYRPAMLALLSDVRTGEPCGLINIYLEADGHDRIRDKKGKTTTGQAATAAVMLSDFDEPTMGLVICEGVETGISLFMQEMRPVWACGGAGNLGNMPVLGGIEAVTIAADAGGPGQKAAAAAVQRWRQAGRDAVIITPRIDDWAIREALS